MTPISDCARGRARPGYEFEFRHVRTLLAACLLMLAPIATAIQPVTPEQNARPKLTRAFLAPELAVQPELEATIGLNDGISAHAGVSAFVQRHGGQWEMRWDRRADRPNLVQGSGIALIPGRGNQLDMASLGLATNDNIDLAMIETRLRDFIEANSDLLKTGGLDFRLDPQGSIPYGDGRSYWFLELAQVKNDVPVRGANLFFRISHGNIVQFGSHLVAPVEIDTQPVSTRANAFDLAVRELGFPAGTTIETIVEPGELLLLPVTPAGEDARQNYSGAAGAGYAHRLAWRFVFRVADDVTTYQILFDAHSNRVIEVSNLTVNADATVTGGIYPTTNTDPEIVVPMPFAAISNNGAKVTDVLGIYDYSGGTATVTLDGKYFRMSDGCGAISLANSSDGNLNLGTSGGTDCVTPGVGGAGNTHASRSGFYHLTNINRKAVNFFPGNGWLASKVTANMNINDQCNAGWDGSTLNFFKSGGGCSNTGEIAAVFLHEWGHGMDTNSGGAANEYGSGEAVGDTFAFLETKDACIGKNFIPGQPCHNCETSCTGVRDVEAFSTHGAAVIAKPSLITDNGGPNCDRWACPYLQQGIFPYQGPMGYEGHCESYIASSANWDLTQALVAQYGTPQGWQEMDRIWYGSLTPSKSAYRITSGGKCNVNAQIDGCGANNWYTVFLAADDDNGNLADGTPNGCRIWDAFDAHDIACGTRPACTASSSDFSLEVTSDDHRTICSGLSTPVSYNIDVGAIGDFSDVVTLDLDGEPTGTTVSINPNAQPAGFMTDVIIDSPPGPVVPATGDYELTLSGSAIGSPGHSVPLFLAVRETAGTTVLTTPANGATGVAVPTTFTWQPAAHAESYLLRVYSDLAQQDLVVSAELTKTTYTTSTLQPGTTYYWVAMSTGSCGGGSAAFSFTTAPAQYHVGGTVDGLVGNGLMLRLNDTSDLPIGADGAFQFQGLLDDGAGYAVSVAVQPGNPAQTCSVSNGVGNIAGADVSNVAVTCVTIPPPAYTVGGTANGLAGNGLALSLNGGANLAVGTNGSFTFPDELADGAGYAVSVTAQPGNPAQTCLVSGGVGNIAGADVTNVAVNCVTDPPTTYTVGGTVNGLVGSGLVLSLDGGTHLSVDANGSFTFPDALADGASYAVTVATQPNTPAQECSVANGDGTVVGANVADVAVSCGPADTIFKDGFED